MSPNNCHTIRRLHFFFCRNAKTNRRYFHKLVAVKFNQQEHVYQILISCVSRNLIWEVGRGNSEGHTQIIQDINRSDKNLNFWDESKKIEKSWRFNNLCTSRFVIYLYFGICQKVFQEEKEKIKFYFETFSKECNIRYVNIYSDNQNDEECFQFIELKVFRTYNYPRIENYYNFK